MLDKNARRRISAADALEHAWMRGTFGVWCRVQGTAPIVPGSGLGVSADALEHAGMRGAGHGSRMRSRVRMYRALKHAW